MGNNLVRDSAGVPSDAGRIKYHRAVVTFGLGRLDCTMWGKGGYRRRAGFDGGSSGSDSASRDRRGNLPVNPLPGLLQASQEG